MTERSPDDTGHEVLIQLDTSEILAVVDTNVLLDIFSCHDLVNMYERFGQADADAHVDSEQAVYRRARARESLLLAFYFHGVRATTYSLQDEVLALIQGRVDPAADDTMETQYAMQFAHCEFRAIVTTRFAPS